MKLIRFLKLRFAVSGRKWTGSATLQFTFELPMGYGILKVTRKVLPTFEKRT